MNRTLKAALKDMWPIVDSPISVTTTTSYHFLDKDTEEIVITGSDAYYLKFSPRIKNVWFYDDSEETWGDGATAGSNSAATELQDGDSAVALTLSDMTDADKLYIRLDVPCVGFDVDVVAVNSNASVLTVKYWNGTVFYDTSDTDGTITSSTTLAKDGVISWSEPSDEEPTEIHGVTGYWYEITVDATLDAAVTIAQMQALSRRGWNIMETDLPTYFSINREEIAGIELDCVGTSTVQVSALKY